MPPENHPARPSPFGTPEEIAASLKEQRDEAIREVTEGPHANHFLQAAQTMHAMQSIDEKNPDAECGVRSLAIRLLNNLEDFRRKDDPYNMITMLNAQANVLDALFNRALQNAGLEDKDSFSIHKAKVALQAQKQCKLLLEFMTKQRDRHY